MIKLEFLVTTAPLTLAPADPQYTIQYCVSHLIQKYKKMFLVFCVPK